MKVYSLNFFPSIFIFVYFIAIVTSLPSEDSQVKNASEITIGDLNSTQIAGFRSRNPKFLKFLEQLLFTEYPPIPSTISGNHFKEKIGQETLPNNQYYAPKDPYNQNQLLNSLGTGNGNPTIQTEVFDSIKVDNGPSSEGVNSINNLFTTLIGDDISSPSAIISNILNLGSGSMESLLTRINKFDSLRCIPRLLCQTVATGQQQPITEGSNKIKTTNNTKSRRGKTIKFQGFETALDQFMGFLDLFQLKNWSLYPYLKGAYEGSQVKRLDECAEKFRTCPFTDQQLVYYFNNYNGGFFQSIRSDF